MYIEDSNEDLKVNRDVTENLKLWFFSMFNIWELQHKNDFDVYIISHQMFITELLLRRNSTKS